MRMDADADFDAAVLGLALPAGVEQALREAGAARGDAVAVAEALMRAQALAPEHPAVLIAFYRHHFYGHRLRLARNVARRALAVGAGRWACPRSGARCRHGPCPAPATARARAFDLFVLKGYAYLGLRLDDPVEARDALALLRALDPGDCVGAALLEAVRQRAVTADAEDILAMDPEGRPITAATCSACEHAVEPEVRERAAERRRALQPRHG